MPKTKASEPRPSPSARPTPPAPKPDVTVPVRTVIVPMPPAHLIDDPARAALLRLLKACPRDLLTFPGQATAAQLEEYAKARKAGADIVGDGY